VLIAIAVTLLFQFGVQVLRLRLDDPGALPFIVALSQLSLMLLPAVMAARAQEMPPRELFRLRKVPVSMHVAVLVGILALWPIVQAYLIVQELYLIPDDLYGGYRELQQRMEQLYEQLLPAGDLFSPVVAIIAGALVPGICEEAVFRGAAQRSFERRMRPLFAIALASLLFASLHLQPHNFVPLLALGMFLGLAAWSSGSIFPAIVGHFFFNALMIGALSMLRASGQRPGTHSESDLVELLPGVAICIAIVAVDVRWLLRRGRMRAASIIVPEPETITPTDER
jgi:hypothetical protein